MMFSPSRNPLHSFASAALFAVALAGTAQAQSDQTTDVVTQLNKQFYGDIAANKRSDTLLLPALAKMASPPAAVAKIERSALVPAGSADWAAAEAWAKGETQQNVLKVLATVTAEPDWRKAFGFGQPYGTDGVSIELIKAGLYTELGDPPTLAAANHRYLTKFDELVCLANVEATRLTAEGKASDAIDLLTNLAYFGRQMCDRQFYDEAAWGLSTIAQACERIRDVAYTDFTGEKKIDIDRIVPQIKRLEMPEKYLDLNRMKFPQGDKAGTRQIVDRVYENKGKVKQNVFGPTMAKLGSSKRPLRLFSEAAFWMRQAESQGDWFDVSPKADGVYSDFERRWKLDYFDKAQGNVTTLAKLTPGKAAAVTQSSPTLEKLVGYRQIAKTEIAGTRQTLALVAFAIRNGVFAPQISSVRPLWMEVIEDDPFNADRADSKRPAFEYFVPIRDHKKRNPREEDKPHEMDIVTQTGANFGVTLRQDTFVLYSTGSDYVKNQARRIQNTNDKIENGDYLIYPPIMSLYRKHLQDRQELK